MPPPPSCSLAALALAAGCGERRGGRARGRIPVVATTTQAADLARNVGGDRGRRSTGCSRRTPTRTSTRSARATSKALGRRRPGRALGRRPRRLARRRDRQRRHRRAGARRSMRTARAARQGDDPHWWQDPRNAERAVGGDPRARSTRADPAGARGYARRARARTRAGCARSTAPSRAARTRSRRASASSSRPTTRSATTPRRYGLEVIGAVIPSLSTQAPAVGGRHRARSSTPSGATRVRAIFAESSVNPKVERAIAREAGARVGARAVGGLARPAGLRRRDLPAARSPPTRARSPTASSGGGTCSLPAA